MPEWNYADVLETVAGAIGDRAAQIHGDRVITWAEWDRRADALAADLLAAGLTEQSKVAVYTYNGPEYLETYFAAFKAGLAPVNTNYRYGPEEILYLFDNADAEAVVFHASFTELLDGIRARLPKVKRWYCVADATGPGPEWAHSYDTVVAASVGRTVAPWGRSGDHLLLLYTGGTTGMPKGVMWRQDDLFNVLGAGGNPMLGLEAVTSLDELAARVSSFPPGLSSLIACPLMHGTGQFTSFITLAMGGAIVSLPSRRFDVGELWHEVARLGVTGIAIVGQAFAGPMLEWLDAHPGEVDLSSVGIISSSGVMWSQDNKDGLLRHVPQAVLIDTLGSSEAVGLGSSASGGGNAAATASFMVGPHVRRLHRRRPSGRTGIGRSGHGRGVGPHPARLLQGRGEVGPDVPHLRGSALERARRLGRDRARWQPQAARPGLGVHQHRRREGLPGRGRRGAQDPRFGARRRRRRDPRSPVR